MLTETDDLARAIDAVSALYPGETRTEILRRLIRLGAETMAQQKDQHRHNVSASAGHFPGLYSPDYLDDLRQDWPE